jgi:beta-phosphoglucomutase-like phosphatase (HAD superfamily)
MTLCYELSEESSQNDDENDDKLAAQRLERQDLFVTRADTVLRPLFRYCQYELKQEGKPTMEEPRLASSADKNTHREDNDAIVFRDQELVLDNKELRVLLLKFQSLEQEQKEQQEEDNKDDTTNNETHFLTSLSVLDDALEVVQSLEQGLGKVAATGGPAVQAKLRQYALWKGYLQYSKTQKVMEHTERLLVESMGPAEKVHIYDALLKHAKSLLALPRPDQQDGGIEEEDDDEFALQIQANILRLRALKTYNMGWFYYTLLHKYGPALALMEYSTELCKRAQEEIAACDEDMPHADEYLQQLENLPLASASGAICAAMALQQRQHARKLKNAGADASAALLQEPISTDRPLLLRLYDNDGGTPDAPIADLRPMPLPCKPVFYDLAYDYALDPTEGIERVESFVYEHTVAPVDDEEDDGKTGGSSTGLFGWLTGSSS